MTPQSKEAMKMASHTTAEWVLRRPCHSNRCKWVRQKVGELLTDPAFIEKLTAEYDAEYPYSDVQSSYLVDALKAYDEGSTFF